MAAMQTLVLPYWAVLLVLVTFAFTETAIIVDKSSSLTPALDDKGSSSASEDFIDLDASPSHVLHEVVDGSKESEMGDSHDSMPLQRPKTTIEVDSDETDDVIHSGSGDDLETLDLEKNGDKSVLSHSRAEALTSNANTTSTMAYPSSTQANYNPSTSTTSTSTYTTTQAVRLSTTSNTTQPSSANISGATTIMPPRKVLPASSEEGSKYLSDEDESSGSGSGSGESQCNENNCKYGGVCDLDAEDPQCICDFGCKKKEKTLSSSVCGSDSILYSDICVMKWTSCIQQKPIVQKTRSFCIKQKPQQENCTEHESNATWTAWSPWIQSGDVDIRFRTCNITIGSGKNATNVTCHGERMQTRACPVTETKTCVTSNGTDSLSMTYQCKGINPMDTHIKDSAFLQYPEEGKCRYSLYDVESARYKFIDWTYSQLREEGKVRQWCGGPLEIGDNYRLRQRKRWNGDLIAMHTPLRACRVKLDKFCRDGIPPCSYTKRDGQRWTDNNNKGSECLQNLTIDGMVPSGIPNPEGGMTFLCQRFSASTVYGKMFNTRRSHFATMYDTMKRIPTYSVSKLSVIDSKGWPRTPFMVERNLIDKQTQSSWFYMIQTRKKGLAAVSELEKEIRYDQCATGKYQATPSDYEYTSYRIGQLLSPQLVGHRVDDQVASFAMTNTVPMHRDFYVEWKRVSEIIYKYAKEVCRVPRPHEAHKAAAAARKSLTSTTAPTSTAASSSPETTTSAYSTGTAYPSTEGSTEAPASEDPKYGHLYLVAGAVPTLGCKKTVGNGVNVPHLIWMGGCCVHGNETKGFAVYGQNSAQSSMGATSLPQLEILLSQEYTKHTKRSHPFKIKIFPGFQGRCSSAQNDDSLNLNL